MPQSIIEAIQKSADYLPANTVIYRVNHGLERLYYSPGIPALSGYTQEEFAQQEQENAMGLLLTSDRALVSRKLNECVENKTGSNFVYRLSHKTKGYIWVHAITKYLGVLEGFPVIVANLINISTEMMANNIILDSSNRAIALVEKHSWDVLYANQAFLVTAHITEEECTGKPFPKVVCNMGAWDEEQCIRMCLEGSGKPQLVSGENGKAYSVRAKPVLVGEHEAIAVYMTDVSERESNYRRIEQLQKDIVSRYRQQINTIMKMNPDALSTFQVNITQDICTNGVSAFTNLLQLQNRGTVSGYFEAALHFIPAEEHAMRAAFTRENCLAAFYAGKTSMSADCHFLLGEKDVRLIRTTLAMMENPLTHDIEGVLYTLDLEQRNLFGDIFSQLFDKEYDGASIIHLRSGTYSLLRFKFDETVLDHSKNLEYTAGLNRLVEKYVVEEDRENYLKKASLQSITDGLRETGVYSFTARCHSDLGETRLKKVSYYYLNSYHDSILAVTEDITDLTRKEQQHVQELRAALTSAEQATEAKTTFLSNISHDMRTPLNGVLGFARLAKEESTLAGKNEDIDKIISSGDFLLQLINDTLDLSKIESNSMTLQPEVHDAESIVREAVCAVEELAAQKGVALKVDLSEAETMSILVDKLRLQQVYVNLLGNAIKFTPSGGRVDLIVRKLNEPVQGRNYCVTVQDNGCGMSADFISHAFEAYSQQANLQTSRTMGTGLGLAIVKKIVTMMGGLIELHSEEGKGTRFDVYLPITRAPEQQEEPSPVRAEVSLAGKRILLCEDHAINRELAKRLLERKEMIVTTAENGQIGLDAFESSAEGSFDAILMDIRMPVMDGLEAAKAIRATHRSDALTVPLIAMTANAFDADKRSSQDAGMTAHLAKPINPEELYATLLRTICAYRGDQMCAVSRPNASPQSDDACASS